MIRLCFNGISERDRDELVESSMREKVHSILTGTGDDDVDSATPGKSRNIVLLYLKIINFIKKTVSSLQCKKKEDEELKEENKLTKYVCAEFNAWTYNGSDHLWKSILIEIWEAVAEVYGYTNLQRYRTSVELQRSQENRGSSAAIDGKSLFQQRQAGRDTLDIWTLISLSATFFTGAITTISSINKFRSASNTATNPFLKVLYSDVVLYTGIAILALSLIVLVKNIITYVRYVLPTVQINDRASSKREKYLSNTGFEGFVKEEFEYILDFLRYAPLPKKHRKRHNNARLSILIDDLDRCESESVMKILQAVILLLNDAPVTCWLALDTGIVVSSIEQAMKDQLDEAGMTGYDFVEKIIQLPLCIPDLDTNQKTKFLSRLFVQDKLDPAHLVKLVGELVALYPRIPTLDTSNDSFVHDNYSFGGEEYTEERALRMLVHRMKNVMESSSFESKLAFDSDEVIQKMENAVLERTWQEMEKSDKEDFLFLVCEWIEWFQENFRNVKQQEEKPKQNEQGNNDSENNPPIDEEQKNDDTESRGRTTADNVNEVDSQPSPGSHDQVTPPQNDIENPVVEQVIYGEIRPVLETMVSIKEKTWFNQYACYMTGKARTMTRIVNIYNLARYLVDNNVKGEVVTDRLRKKLLKVVILCEQWPYRMSWLMQIAEDAMQESALKDKEEKAEKQSVQVFEDLDYLGLKIVKKGKQDNHGNNDRKDIQNRNASPPKTTSFVSNDYSGSHQDRPDDSVEREASVEVEERRSQDIVESSYPLKKDHEEEVFDRMNKLSLFNIYHLVVQNLLYSSDNVKKDLSRDGDPQTFKQLLAEDDCDLKLIDIALPNQFTKKHELNDSYTSLRPFMVNMYRHTIEKTAKCMERCIIHDNGGVLGMSKGGNNNDNENSIGPMLLIEGAESYYKKPNSK